MAEHVRDTRVLSTNYRQTVCSCGWEGESRRSGINGNEEWTEHLVSTVPTTAELVRGLQEAELQRELGKVQLKDEPALRFDAGKPRMDLIPPEALIRYGEVLNFGATKYSERNWERGMSKGRMVASLLRHVVAYMRGEENDPESGLPHMAHAMWNAGALITYHDRGMV
jgi:hypothetical protein